MNHMNKSYIIKTYIKYPEDSIVLYLEDTRDNYINPKALGIIGNICIAKGYISCNPTEEDETAKIQVLKEALQEIFGTANIDPLSQEHYDIIMTKVKDGTLASLGYVDVTNEYEPIDIIGTKNKKH